jgi:RNA polymerase sigma-70 factor (ECF subfamily)
VPFPPEDWTRVVEKLLEGDRLALVQVNRLVTSFLTQIRAYDFHQEWEDLRQEVVLSIVANARAGGLRDPQAFVGYVRSVTRNKFVDRLERAARTHERRQVAWDEEAARMVGGGDGTRPDRDAADVWWTIADLPSQQQQVLVGVYRQGQTYEEVARDTGIPLGTVKRRLREGLAELRRRLAEGGGNG